jgi:hypothetical protein
MPFLPRTIEKTRIPLERFLFLADRRVFYANGKIIFIVPYPSLWKG